MLGRLNEARSWLPSPSSVRHAASEGGRPRVGYKTIISWNLLRRTGASLDDITRLIRLEAPDLLLMQEVTPDIAGICDRVGGHFVRSGMPDRIHGLAIWSPTQLTTPTVAALPRGAIFQRVCQVVDIGDFQIANVHLSHGQVLNRRQLRRISDLLPAKAAVLGDFNLVGPAFLPGFRDVGPRLPTHRMADLVPLRLDRCLVRGLAACDARVLPRQRSDHRPIVVRLSTDIGSERRLRRGLLADLIRGAAERAG